MTDVRLIVGGMAYSGWTSVRVTRTIEALSGSFELGFTDRWSEQAIAWPIQPEDQCEIRIGNETLISGWIAKRNVSISGTDRALSVQGHDKASALVDCSAVLSDWEFLACNVIRLAERLAAPFGIRVTAVLAPLPDPVEKLSIDHGDSCWDVLERACRMAGVMAISDGKGGLMLTRPGSARALRALVEGENLLAMSAESDASRRFSRYIVTAQRPGGEDLKADETIAVEGFARDAAVRRKDRVLIVRADSAATPAYAARRAEWEAIVRAAKAEPVTARVEGWTQDGITPWPINAIVQVRSPSLGIDGPMLIAETTFSVDSSGGSVTELQLRRADAYRPAPVVSSSNQWAELKRGVR